MSDPSNGNFLFPRSITVDQTDGFLVLVDEGSNAVVRMDPLNGNGMPDFRLPSPRAVAVDATNASLIVVDALLRAVVRVDQHGIHTISGCTVITDPTMPCPSDALVGQGPLFLIPEAVAVEPGGRVWVLDVGLDAVFRVDVHDGKRFIVPLLRP